MRRSNFIIGSLFSIGLIGSSVASAADMATKAPLAGPAIASWTGCYFGANAGGGRSDFDTARIGRVTGQVYGVPDNFGSSNGTGFVGGGQVGCDYQADRLVVGAQGQFDFGSLHSANPSPFFPSTFARVETTATATATVRAGVLVTPQVLAYVKGGGAWAQTDTGIYGTVPHLYLAESASPNRLGWTVGGGLEWMFAPNWSVFGEYNYMDFGTRNVNFVTSPQAVGIPDVVRTRLKTQTVLAGINYHFNWGGPVVARY